MGNTCAPDHEVGDVNVDTFDPSEKISGLINSYQTDNERIKQELEILKSENVETTKAYRERTEQNELLMKHLTVIRSLIAKRDRAVLRHLLEAALYSKANSLIPEDNFLKKLKEGWVNKFGRAGKGKSKAKWVEIYLQSGERNDIEFTKGNMILIWADHKDFKVSNRGRILKVNDDSIKVPSDVRVRSFSMSVKAKGEVKELVFECTDKKSKDAWVQMCKYGLAQIEEEWQFMTRQFSIEITFCKEKLGFRVKELILGPRDDVGVDLEVKVGKTVVSTTTQETDSVVEGEKASEEPIVKESLEPFDEKSKDDGQRKVVANEEYEENAQGLKSLYEDKKQEGPCELLVTEILNEDLFRHGLVEYTKVWKINDIILSGMTYSKQLPILNSTRRPCTITFTGENYLKRGSVFRDEYSSILKELGADEENDVQSVFYELVKGSAVGEELESCVENRSAAIKALLSDRGRLITLLQNIKAHEE